MKFFEMCGYYDWGLFQRASAAFFAMALRLAGVSAAARALPPLSPPSRPSVTAAGFLAGSGGSSLGIAPVARWTISNAVWFRSLGPWPRLLDRLAIYLQRGASHGPSQDREISNGPTTLRLPHMDRRELFGLAMQVGVWLPVFVAIFVPLIVHRSTRKEPYLKRVARKYSIPPLDLR